MSYKVKKEKYRVSFISKKYGSRAIGYTKIGKEDTDMLTYKQAMKMKKYLESRGDKKIHIDKWNI
jgi:hypothetical protein